ncbi:MAG TPA: hypothetical protein VFZ65_02000 [Planctomycetota bacterium]|nr:hypothetical protein [Planctomycetota bacterium]
MYTPIPHRSTPPRPASAGHPLRVTLVLAVPMLALAAALFAVTTWLRPPDAGRADREPTPSVALDSSAQNAEPAGAPVTRHLVSQPAAEASTAAPAAADATFEERIEQLVTLGMRTAQLAQQDEIDAAKASDQEVRRLFEDLMQRFADAGERGLARLAGMPDPGTDARDAARRVVLQLVLRTELARRHDAANAAADRSRIDPLVQSLLDVMPQASATAEIGGDLLANRPYLRLVHEPGVLALVRLAGEQAFSRPIATRLLLTLWDNLQRTGERSSEELCQLAMLLLADADPSRRTAACRQLLVDVRYRGLVMSWLRERNDLAVANEVAGLAARELPPADALAVLRELAPILPSAPGAYVVLAHRAPEVVATCYRELLASDIQPGMRKDLIAGVGMTSSALGLELAQLALQNDPSPDVRMQAVFALTANAAGEPAERALQQVLDDPEIAGNPTRLDAVVFALQNLEVGGHTNAVDRVGQRLRSMSLSASGRRELEVLLARSLPGGKTSLPTPR